MNRIEKRMSGVDDHTALSAGLHRVVGSIASQVPAVQCRVDRAFLSDVRDYAAVLSLTRGTPFAALAQSLCPAPVVLQEVGVSLQLAFGRTVENEFAVRIVNAQFQSRYGRARHLTQKIDLTIQRVPLRAGAELPLSSPLEECLNE